MSENPCRQTANGMHSAMPFYVRHLNLQKCDVYGDLGTNTSTDTKGQLALGEVKSCWSESTPLCFTLFKDHLKLKKKNHAS